MDMKGVKEASSSRTSVKFTSSDEGGEGGSPHSSLQREVVEETSREGWLKKKGTWSSWKDVYVVVKGGLLLEYKKEGVRSLALPTNQPTAAARYTRGHSVFLTYWRR